MRTTPPVALRALAAEPGEDVRLARLADGLVQRAQARGLLDVAYRTFDTPIGTLLLAATERGLVRIAFACQDLDAVLAELAGRISPRVLAAPRPLDPAARQLEEYFAGRRREFDVPLDFTLAAAFRREVLERLRLVGYGQTTSYARLAASTGRPRAVRAAGTACARNPLPVVVPCHRVLRSDGGIGGYAGGTEAKRTLLALEGGGRQGPPLY